MWEYYEQVKYRCSFEPVFLKCLIFIDKNRGHEISINKKPMPLFGTPVWVGLCPLLQAFQSKPPFTPELLWARCNFTGKTEEGLIPLKRAALYLDLQQTDVPVAQLLALLSPPTSPAGLSVWLCSFPSSSALPVLSSPNLLIMRRNLVLP